MRIILDTNVFVSGVFFTGPPYRILEAWRDGKHNLVISPDILEEYQRVGVALAEQFPPSNVQRILELVAIHAEIVDAAPLRKPVCEDSDDDKFFACAVAGKVHCIVSGDKHLLQVSGYRGVQVMKPREFVEKYLGKRGEER